MRCSLQQYETKYGAVSDGKAGGPYYQSGVNNINPASGAGSPVFRNNGLRPHYSFSVSSIIHRTQAIYHKISIEPGVERDEAAARRAQPPETDEMTGTPEGWHKATQQIETMHYTTPFARGSDNFLGVTRGSAANAAPPPGYPIPPRPAARLRT